MTKLNYLVHLLIFSQLPFPFCLSCCMVAVLMIFHVVDSLHFGVLTPCSYSMKIMYIIASYKIAASSFCVSDSVQAPLLESTQAAGQVQGTPQGQQQSANVSAIISHRSIWALCPTFDIWKKAPSADYVVCFVPLFYTTSNL